METIVNDTLLTKYLAEEVNSAERAIVDSWLAAHEDNRQYLDTLRQAWQLADARETLDYVLEEMNMDDRWAQFRKSTTKKQTPVRALLAIAATIALLVALSWSWFSRPPSPVTEEKKIAAGNPLHHEINNTGKDKKIILPDSTEILLGDQSALTWQEPFNRTISMNGKAFFTVIKNGASPFAVTSGEITTTVLGTTFSVNATHILTVRLYTGKVMISSGNVQRMKNKVYLTPGQEFIYGSKIIVRTFLQPAQRLTMDRPTAEDPYIAKGDEHNWYMFNNQSLAQVLNQLSALYKVKIIYDQKDIRDIYFTARYDRTASLADILQRIATLNNLKMTNNDSVMIISK